MRDGPRCFAQNSSCSALLRMPLGLGRMARTGLSPSPAAFSNAFRCPAVLPRRGPTTPAPPKRRRFGLFRVRHYLRNHFCFLLLRVLRCFSSPRSPHLHGGRPPACRVAPFGNPGIKDYLHLPRAFRSLSRPSSPPRAKASTVCPCLLSMSRHLRAGLIFLKLALLVTLLNVQHVKDLPAK